MTSKLITATATLLVLLFAGIATAQTGTIDLGSDPAVAVAGGDLPASDARVVKARGWLKKVSDTTGENEEQVAAAAIKLAKYLLDSARVHAQPMEALEGMAVQAASGKILGDLTGGYFLARTRTPGQGHAEALTALTAKK
jgi:hypothetical protein